MFCASLILPLDASAASNRKLSSHNVYNEKVTVRGLSAHYSSAVLKEEVVQSSIKIENYSTVKIPCESAMRER